MSGHEIANIFNIPYPYDENTLKTAYVNKLNNIRNNNTLTRTEKYVLAKKYHQTYKLNNQHNMNIKKVNNMSRGFTYSYMSKNNNGEQTIAEKKTEINNGKTYTNSNAYSINKNGTHTKLNYDDVMKQNIFYKLR